ncbi:YodC family protein [Singulisphaera acidiphila]|uniref:Uncharacterized small protein n=1 Tax=Singulisphaera acidiphila (strain ATCC BAA-1392 / DSM 18658 / VKM B-2454 / MOB10) TaxID=886293 RepID=L0DAZ9_SINAD|nr:DUF2158 domain-containing protein [Singulisphaera acidiphila]AGA26030.1 uncharacterized small protein [Singulisphaera acidiphila DSM 18658]
MAIKAGDIVQLKTGGPRMSVGGILVNQEAMCYWFDDHDVFQQQQIFSAALVLAKDE